MPRDITDFVAKLILPPAGPLLLMACGAALALRGRRRIGTFLGTLGFSGLWVCSVGVVGTRLLRGLEAPPASEGSFAGAGAIVVLGAGRVVGSPEYGEDAVSSEGLVRLRYAARLARKTGLPLLVAGGKTYGGRLSEGEAMARALAEDFRTPARWIEGESATTAENAARAFALLRPEGRTRVLLVTSAPHMRRARAAFAKAGFDVVAAPTGYASRARTRPIDWLPTPGGLAATRYALWELLGMAWYRLRGVV